MPGKNPESVLWEHFKKVLTKVDRTIHAVRVENMLMEGHPDVDLCAGGVTWNIELKRVPYWPKRKSTIVKVTHYTKPQRDWLKARLLTGGKVAILIAIDREEVQEFFLFTHGDVLLVGKMTRTQMYERCADYWCHHIDGPEIVKILKGYR